ncbi:gliding motility-associated ABC transporter substrate-binding protein GldG [Neolewinella sp.]|uniref:gliding motility-associated ABC transporter substrate-binding protein GldG n=1 Tax=Neolewinella sp. TaxID=2993543 RepID=UPI003B52BC26
MPPRERIYRRQALLRFALGLCLLVVVNVLAHSRLGGTRLYTALDLTEDRRYTLSTNTRNQLTDLTEPLYVRVLLAGELPAGYQRLRTALEEKLEDFAGYTDYLQFEFADPLAGTPDEVRQRQEAMFEDGIVPVTDYQQSAGERTARAVYPYALVYGGEQQRIVPLLEASRPDVPLAQQLNQAENLLEYNLTRAIAGLTAVDKYTVAFTLGNGELPPAQFADLVSELRKDYEVGPLYLDSVATVPDQIDLLIVAKPTVPFTPEQAFRLDQYVMQGGKVIWAIDGVAMDYDSLQATGEAIPQARTTGLEDLFFSYGFRVSTELVLDLANSPIPIATSQGPTGPRFTLVPFPYHVTALPASDQPIVQNIDAVDLRYPTLLEEVGGATDLNRTILLTSSDNARLQAVPSVIDLDAQKFSVELERFNRADLPLALVLEGTFESPYANRMRSSFGDFLRRSDREYRSRSVPTAMLVVSDGDVLANSVSNRGEVGTLGVNRFSGIPYANKTFMLNAIAYLLDPTGIINSRNKEVRLRLLDQNRALAEAGYWRSLNLAVPLLLLAVFGLLFNILRRRRYAR